MKRETFWRDSLLWAIVSGAFFIRLIYNLVLNPHDDPTRLFVIDEREYFAASHMFAEGRGLSFYDTFLWVRPPLYVLVLGSVFRVFGTDYLPTLALQSLLSAATLVPLAWLAYKVIGRAGARWTALFGAIYLPFTLFAGLLLSETLFLLLFALALAWLLRAREALAQGGRASLLWPALAGGALGLATLTRANALAFVPLAAIWLLWGRWRSNHHRGTESTEDREGSGVRDLGSEEHQTPNPQPPIPNSSHASRITHHASRFAPALALVAVCALVILPWMVRNVAAYGGFFVDTTGGYNLWLGSVGVRDEPRLQADLKVIPDQAERQQFALARAWENISADPLGFIGKGLKESLDLWKPQFSAEERQVAGYAWGRVPGWHLVALLIFDDLLYLLILGFALFGLAASPPQPLKSRSALWTDLWGYKGASPDAWNALKSLTALWVVFWVVMSFVFFAVTRFRLPVVAALLPWAGVGVSLFLREGLAVTVKQMSRVMKGALGVALLALLVVVIPVIEWGQTWLGVQRWGEQEGYRRGEALLRDGRVNEAFYPSEYEKANRDIPDTRYFLAALYLRMGFEETALSYILEQEVEGRFEPAILRGEIARRQGDLETARAFFNAREVQVAGNEALEWAWNHLDPPEVEELQVGSGLDVGYIKGFYGPERTAEGETYRWSGPRAEIRNVMTAAMANDKILWSGWRPGGTGKSVVTLYGWACPYTDCYPDKDVIELPNEPSAITTSNDYHTATISSYQTRYGFDLFTVNGFIASGADPRLLGVRVFSIGVEK